MLKEYQEIKHTLLIKMYKMLLPVKDDMGRSGYMRKKIHLKAGSEYNAATDKWIEHLVQRIIVEQLDIPHQLQAKLLYRSLIKRKEDI